MSASNRNTPSAPFPIAKGFIKPFKGKGGIIRFRDELQSILPSLNGEVMSFIHRYNPVVIQCDLYLVRHGSGTRGYKPIQWRDRARKKMGRGLLDQVLGAPVYTDLLKQRLVAIETERSILNAKLVTVASQLNRLDELIEGIEATEALIG
ncbi:DUF3158 family protein [Carnimonas bestiolae]|uniref:DUF3158 family protein n=1 Tax=Carnimonas bestiolae TaxID=3402172 RepID=UPI003EDC0BB9